MSFWAFLDHWWNLPSLVMLGLVGAHFALQTVGLVGQGGDGELEQEAELEHELEHEVEHELDGDVETDLEAGHEQEAELESEPEHDVDAEQEHDHEMDPDTAAGSGGTAALTGTLASQSFASSLGIGRVPFTVVWLTLFIFTGFSQLFINRFLFIETGGAYRAWFFPLAVAGSLVVGIAATRFASRLVWKVVDVGGRGSTKRSELPGRLGVVASACVDSQHGEVRVRDERGDELIVHACIERGRAALQGEQVVLLEYDGQRGLYTVALFEDAAAGIHNARSTS